MQNISIFLFVVFAQWLISLSYLDSLKLLSGGIYYVCLGFFILHVVVLAYIFRRVYGNRMEISDYVVLREIYVLLLSLLCLVVISTIIYKYPIESFIFVVCFTGFLEIYKRV